MRIVPIRAAWVPGVIVMLAATAAEAQEPDWTGRVVKLGAERAIVNSQPIVERPYRPLHVYGNTVRRWHYRNRLLPAPRDLSQATRAWVWRP